MNDNWHAGNAVDESGQYRGWLLGHFIDTAPDSVRKTDALEIKWGIHPAGQSRDAWTSGEKRSTLVIMVDGRFRVDLAVGSVTLKSQGDYLTWGPGIDHSWQAEEDSTVITVRWPSIP
jgi:quercetin dioxygenase-like cupin family protein